MKILALWMWLAAAACGAVSADDQVTWSYIHAAIVVPNCATAGWHMLLPGCLEVPKPKAQGIEVKDVKVSDGVELTMACVPTGIEMCFDALDNNCNGVIDEGCGVHTGVLQFTIAWDQAQVDVDLQLNGPDGELARFDHPNSSGLQKDRDCPRDCYGQNVENAYLAEGAPRRGRYRVLVRLERLNETDGPIQVRLAHNPTSTSSRSSPLSSSSSAKCATCCSAA